MATLPPYALTGPAGVRLYGGRFAPASFGGNALVDEPAAAGGAASAAELSGNAQLEEPGAAGGLASAVPSELTGNAQVDEPSAAGGLQGTVSGPPTSGFTTIALTSASTQTAPFAVGQAFKPGDLPSGSTLAGLQTTVKNAWPDGSAKFAIVAGVVDLTAATPRNVGLQVGAAASGSVLTTTNLKASLTQPVTVDAGGFGSASWSGTDWDAPFATLASGPVMSSWQYRKQIGSDAHLVAWLEVRLWSTGAVEVLPWVENGYLTVAGPTSKAATFNFTMGGSARLGAGLAITLLNHQRTPLLSGTAVSHWLGTDPDLAVRHDVAYLQATRLVPFYGAVVSPSALVVTGQPASFTPLQQGSFPNGMGTGGYGSSIGLLPEWDVLYLTCTAPALWKVVQWQGYSAGRYGIHFRDNTASGGDANRPIRFSSHPDLGLDLGRTSGVEDSGTASTYTPAATGGVPPIYKSTHAPAMGYMAYLLTGRAYHLETVQFQATVNYLKQNSSLRSGSQGLILSEAVQNATRGAAWKLRTLAQAAALTPDGDVLRTEFASSFSSNVDFYHARYVAQANNPQGFVAPYSDYTADGPYYEATWMQDFFTAAIGMAKSLKLPLSGASDTKLAEFFNWKAQSVVYRFGGVGTTEYLYRDAAPYIIAVSPSQTADWVTGTGPWYANWGEIWTATHVTFPDDRNVSPSGHARVEGGLRGPSPSLVGEFPSVDAPWGELQPALAYAVEHGVPYALTAYARMVGASNWGSAQAQFNVTPVYSVVPPPAFTAVPAWRAGQAVNTWREIAGTAISTVPATNEARTTSGAPAIGSGVVYANRLDAWNGLSIDTRTNKVWSVANGGHGDYYGNEVMSIDLLADAPLWREVLVGSSGNVVRETGDLEQYADLTPPSTHSYYGQHILERHDRALRWGGSVAPSGGAIQPVEAYRIGANAWDAWNGATQDPPYGYSILGTTQAGFTELGWSVTKHPQTEDFYVCYGSIKRFRPARVGTGLTMTTLAALPTEAASGIEGATAVDTTRNRLMWLKGQGTYNDPITFNLDTGASTLHTFAASAAADELRALPKGAGFIGSALGMVYVPQLDAYIVRGGFAGGTLYKVNAATWAVEILPTTGGSAIALSEGAVGDGQQRVYTRLLFVPSLGGVVYFPRGNSNAWFYRLF